MPGAVARNVSGFWAGTSNVSTLGTATITAEYADALGEERTAGEQARGTLQDARQIPQDARARSRCGGR